ncbi:ABC transporter permease subunit [Aureibacillus halotolerans]|uniref:ABC transporter permease subunit n=1 Tax=Aureibacillus halotolerans TaxID=1508390 RepID=UPI001AAC7F0C|nr:ABC transporter permease subunit [Aureibacillus halotolerans]
MAVFWVARYEWFQLIKSFKTIGVIVSLLLMSYGLSSLQNLASEAMMTEDLALTDVNETVMIVFLFGTFGIGFLYVFSLSHDIINRDISLQSIRFTLTKISRLSLLSGKFLGVFMFWFVCITLCLLLLTIFSGTNVLSGIIPLAIFFLYTVAATLLLSLCIPKPGMSMFVGLLLGIGAPIFAIVAQFRDDPILTIIHQYVLPYYPLLEGVTMQSPELYFIPLVWAVVFFALAFLLLNRKDV